MKHLSCIAALVFASFHPAAAADEDLFAAVAENYATMVHANYQDSLTAGIALQESVDAFLAAPSKETLAAARESWIASRQPYLQTEVYRFYAGPIDHEENGPEPLMNGWPMDEGYIDYVDGAPNAGIINDTKNFPELNADLLAKLNEKGGETYISTGYHAIEFLLWGQDFSADGPGDRSYTDYTTAKNAVRRGAYLKITTDLLVEHLKGLVAAWAPNEKNYRVEFLADPATAVHNIVYGAKTLAGTELSGERLLVAWDTQAQEDEHSCFSDTTHQDAAFDARGISNVWLGNYGDVSGPGLEKLTATLLGADAAAKTGKTVAAALKSAEAIPAPFDQAILEDKDGPGRKQIFTTVELLEDLSAELGKVEQALLTR